MCRFKLCQVQHRIVQYCSWNHKLFDSSIFQFILKCECWKWSHWGDPIGGLWGGGGEFVLAAPTLIWRWLPNPPVAVSQFHQLAKLLHRFCVTTVMSMKLRGNDFLFAFFYKKKKKILEWWLRVYQIGIGFRFLLTIPVRKKEKRKQTELRNSFQYWKVEFWEVLKMQDVNIENNWY